MQKKKMKNVFFRFQSDCVLHEWIVDKFFFNYFLNAKIIMENDKS